MTLPIRAYALMLQRDKALACGHPGQRCLLRPLLPRQRSIGMFDLLPLKPLNPGLSGLGGATTPRDFLPNLGRLFG
jgi:hypothetical protein